MTARHDRFTMNFQHQIGRRLRALFGRKRFEAEMAEELRAHLEMQETANRSAVIGFNGGR